MELRSRCKLAVNTWPRPSDLPLDGQERFQSALSSVFHKDGLEPIIRELDRLGVHIYIIGWAAGVNYAPTRNFYTELRLERLNGGKVGYVDPKSIAIDNADNVDFSTLTSGTRVVNLTFGVGLRF